MGHHCRGCRGFFTNRGVTPSRVETCPGFEAALAGLRSKIDALEAENSYLRDANASLANRARLVAELEDELRTVAEALSPLQQEIHEGAEVDTQWEKVDDLFARPSVRRVLGEKA